MNAVTGAGVAVTWHDEATAQAVLAAVPDLWFVIDADGLYVEVSHPQHPWLAAPWAQLRGRPFGSGVPAHVADAAAQALARARHSGTVERTEYTLNTLVGGQRHFEARVLPMPDGRWLYLTRDITELADAQRALRESEARHARALRGTADGLWEWDIRSGGLYLGARWNELLGFADGELPPAEASFFERLHPDDVSRVRQAVQDHLERGQRYDVELRLRTKDGDFRWFRSRGQADFDAAGRPLRMAGSISDITQRRQAEAALRDSEAKFSAIFHTAPVGIGLTRQADGCVLDANDELGRILGWPAHELIGHRTVEFGGWADAPQRARFVEAVLRDGQATLEDFTLRLRSGRTVHCKMTVQALTLGGQALLLSAVTDLSERHAAEQALREQREAFAAVFDGASDAIVSIDDQGRVTMFNPAAERIFGHRAEQVQGGPLDVLLPAEHAARHRQDIARFAGSNVTRRAMGAGLGAGRVRGRHADGRTLELEASISRAEVAGRQVMTAILRDVTDRVQAEAQALRHRFELSALTQRLMVQEKQTTQHLAQVLHDRLGQTLAALRLTIDRGVGAPAGPQIGQLVEQAVSEVRQVLVDLRPPLLDEEGLYAALDNELAMRAPLHPALDLLLEAPPALQQQRWPADQEYALFMIAREALDNALRHASATVVRVSLAHRGPGVRLEVCDDGVGIEDQARRPRPGHLGLIGLRERARAIDAELEIGHSDDGGTSVSVSWSEGG